MTLISNPKVYVKRAWSDIEPKLLAWLTGGTATTGIIYALQTYAGYNPTALQVGAVVTILGTVLGYFVKSNVTTSVLTPAAPPVFVAPVTYAPPVTPAVALPAPAVSLVGTVVGGE